MAKKRITKAELEQRDALGEKIVVICQEQIDMLIKAIGDAAQFFTESETMTKMQFGKIFGDILPKFNILTKQKTSILNEYIKNKNISTEKKNE